MKFTTLLRFLKPEHRLWVHLLQDVNKIEFTTTLLPKTHKGTDHSQLQNLSSSGIRNFNRVVNFICLACEPKKVGQMSEREDIVQGQGEDEVV